ncbi:YfaP family protein [Agarilytica rhodophyticola]|uniref:YfaP family protein n=1 Tax=Agarilytica rhodophyticola TaxID=1737490 RepID=UPI001319F9D3|nr:DUF2135 domain-containing protein [Agarilytica rhodophyticola]
MFFQRMLAFNLLEFNFYTEGIEVLERVKNIRPYQGPSYRDLAIAWQRYSEHTRNNQDAAQAFAYFKAAVFEHWGEDSDGSEPLRMTALEELNHLLYKNDSNIFDLEDIQPNLLFSMPKDIRIVVSWNSRAADVDLHITEPSGEEVSYSKPLSKTGGLMPYDDVDGFGPEEYMIRNATKGKYHISLDLFSNNSIELFGPVSVSLDVFTNYGKKNEKHKKQLYA